MGLGRLPVLAAGAAFVLGSVACAGNEVSPSVAGDGVAAARPAAEDVKEDSSKAPEKRAPSTPRAAGKKGAGSGTPAGSQKRKTRPAGGRAPGAAVAALAVSVEDSPSDAEGDVPGYVEVTGAAVAATRGELTMAVSVAEAIPDRLATPGQAVMFAFDVETAEEQFTVVAQLDHNGVKATLNAGSEATPLDHEIETKELRISVPWRLLGQDRPGFEWTAGTVLMEITADGVSPRGGDSAPGASFPPPATQDDSDEGR